MLFDSQVHAGPEDGVVLTHYGMDVTVFSFDACEYYGMGAEAFPFLLGAPVELRRKARADVVALVFQPASFYGLAENGTVAPGRTHEMCVGVVTHCAVRAGTNRASKFCRRA
jgi:hypothetical protein